MEHRACLVSGRTDSITCARNITGPEMTHTTSWGIKKHVDNLWALGGELIRQRELRPEFLVLFGRNQLRGFDHRRQVLLDGIQRLGRHCP